MGFQAVEVEVISIEPTGQTPYNWRVVGTVEGKQHAVRIAAGPQVPSQQRAQKALRRRSGVV